MGDATQAERRSEEEEEEEDVVNLGDVSDIQFEACSAPPPPPHPKTAAAAEQRHDREKVVAKGKGQADTSRSTPAHERSGSHSGSQALAVAKSPPRLPMSPGVRGAALFELNSQSFSSSQMIFSEHSMDFGKAVVGDVWSEGMQKGAKKIGVDVAFASPPSPVVRYND